MKNFIKIHRVVIDKEARRLFFIENMVKIRIKGLEKDVKAVLPFHPDIPNYGNREFVIPKKEAWVYVEEKDWNNINIGEVFRLKQTLVLKKISQDMAEVMDENVKGKIIHYLPPNHYVKAKVTMPNASIVDGIVESRIMDFPVNTRFQLERYGFVKLDKIYIGVELYYIHK